MEFALHVYFNEVKISLQIINVMFKGRLMFSTYLFFLVNTRDIIESSISTITRFNYPVIYSAKMQENSLIYINSQMQLIPKNKYIIVDFKNLINNVKSFEKIFQEKANINISFNSDKIKQIYHSEYLINIHYNHLKTYFNTIRLQQFNFLRDNICII